MAKNKQDLVFGDFVYVLQDIFRGDLEEDSHDYDDCLFEAGEKGRFIAYATYPEDVQMAIVFFGDDTIVKLYLPMIDIVAPDEGQKYPCPICSVYNSLDKAKDGCMNCGIPYDPFTGDIGGVEANEEEPF